MAIEVLGRTNAAFPPVWLSLATPPQPAEEGWAKALVTAALVKETVLDVSSGPALWGGQMRATESLLMMQGGLDIERAVDDKNAADLIQAHLIETLSSIGREHIDFYFLKVRRGLEEYQIMGALEALENAKQDGHVRFIGLSAGGPPIAVQGMWQFHDAFEVVLLNSEGSEALISLANDRRVGIVSAGANTEGTRLVTVRTPEEVEAAIPVAPVMSGVGGAL